jgi:hypothetical protein
MDHKVLAPELHLGALTHLAGITGEAERLAQPALVRPAALASGPTEVTFSVGRIRRDQLRVGIPLRRCHARVQQVLRVQGRQEALERLHLDELRLEGIAQEDRKVLSRRKQTRELEDLMSANITPRVDAQYACHAMSLARAQIRLRAN